MNSIKTNPSEEEERKKERKKMVVVVNGQRWRQKATRDVTAS